ncbi:MAG: lipase family protein [Ferruginibacter sp.]
MLKKTLPAIFVLISIAAAAQQLKPGFSKEEYAELMKVSARSSASRSYYEKLPAPRHFKMLYQSPVMGLDNMWDLWINENNVAALSIRGTTKHAVSWLANFYAAMVPAKGELQVSSDYNFKYELAANPNATVHTGWLICTAFLSRDMLPKIDSLYKKGVREFYITGHSQGGAIAFLLTAYLYHLQKQQLLPADIRFKTYCSAAPKPGNLYFAYDYEALTQNGWAYNVVNSADWVPETPLSIQTTEDFNMTNPFSITKPVIKKQPFLKKIALNHVYNRLDKSTKKAAKKYRKYLGTMIAKMLKESLPGFVQPVYAKSFDYTRAGNTIVLQADEAYYKLYPNSKTDIFVHHFHKPYLYLLDKLVY